MAAVDDDGFPKGHSDTVRAMLADLAGSLTAPRLKKFVAAGGVDKKLFAKKLKM